MLEILGILIATLFLAKHPKRRRYNLRRVRVSPSIALGALASGVAVASGLTGAAPNSYRCISTSMVWALELGTANEGPITVGYAHSDYTVTEIKEALEAAASIDPGKKIEQERANRLIRIVGTISSDEERLNDGRPVKTRLNWLIAPGDEVNAFAFNDSGASLTTGSILHPMGSVWVKDSV